MLYGIAFLLMVGSLSDGTGGFGREHLDKSYSVAYADKGEIYRFEILRIHLHRALWKIHRQFGLRVVDSNGIEVPSAGVDRWSPFVCRFNDCVAVWCPPWGTKAGVYTAEVWQGTNVVSRIKFSVVSRNSVKLEKGFVVLTLESSIPFYRRKFIGPDGRIGGVENCVRWAKFIGANTIWVLAGQTSGWDRINPSNPWSKFPLLNYKRISKLARKNGILFGAYVMAYYTPHGGNVKAGYKPSLGYNPLTDEVHITKFTSLSCRKRFMDIVKFLSNLNADENVDFVGVDFIRTGEGDGYEMAEEFVRDMNLRVPDRWWKMGLKEKARWLGRMIELYRNRKMIEKWRWWRARKTALTVRNFIEKAGINKPFWVFTLGWEHGKQHGQDPYMMFDAGATIDAVMMYEANARQFSALFKDWRRYVRGDECGNFFLGNTFDANLMDSIYGFDSIGEFWRRNVKAYKKFLGRYPDGIFFHDISRALWGRKGRFYTFEWMLAAAGSVYEYRKLIGKTVVDLEPEDEISVNAKGSGVLSLRIKPKRGVFVRVLPWPRFISGGDVGTWKEVFNGEVKFRLMFHGYKRVMVAVEVKHKRNSFVTSFPVRLRWRVVKTNSKGVAISGY